MDFVEALVKLAVLAIVGIAFLVGGVSSFIPGLAAIVLLIGVVAVAGLACFLIARSRLGQWQKGGFQLFIVAVVVLWFWYEVRAPRQWPEVQATVTSINGPSAVTTTVYSYRPAAQRKDETLAATQTKAWAQLADAKRFRPSPITVYYNPFVPTDVRLEPFNGSARTTATPVSPSQVRVTGGGTAVLRIGTGLPIRTATVTGPSVASYSVGMPVRVYKNALADSELSFSPRETEGGQKYGLLVWGCVTGLVGIGAVLFGKFHPGPLIQPPPLVMRSGVVRPVTEAPPLSTTERLAHIDWFQFEAVAARILESEGWTVKKSGGANPDGGADIICMRDGRKAVVQCKYWQRVLVKPNIIRELLGTKTGKEFSADVAILFTFSDCTEAALAYARQNEVVIRDARAVVQAIERLGIERFPELLNPDKKQCPKCGSDMLLRDKETKPFWGCSNYPITRCRGIIEC